MLLGEAWRSVSEKGPGLHPEHHVYALDSLGSQHSLERLNRKQPLMPGCVAPSTLATQGFSHLQPFQALRDLKYNLCSSRHKGAPEDWTEVRGGGC